LGGSFEERGYFFAFLSYVILGITNWVLTLVFDARRPYSLGGNHSISIDFYFIKPEKTVDENESMCLFRATILKTYANI
jgi:hypothetical protein